MNVKDLTPGTVVYHTIYVHWGPGVVQRVEWANGLERIFERGYKRVVIQFQGREGEVRLTSL